MEKKKISYEASIREIEEILEKIETGNLGVDELTHKVKRVTELLNICHERLHRTEARISQILEKPSDP